MTLAKNRDEPRQGALHALDVSRWEKRAADYSLSEALVGDGHVHLVYEHIEDWPESVTVNVDFSGNVRTVEIEGWKREMWPGTTVRDALFYISGCRDGGDNAHGRGPG